MTGRYQSHGRQQDSYVVYLQYTTVRQEAYVQYIAIRQVGTQVMVSSKTFLYGLYYKKSSKNIYPYLKYTYVQYIAVGQVGTKVMVSSKTFSYGLHY